MTTGHEILQLLGHVAVFGVLCTEIQFGMHPKSRHGCCSFLSKLVLFASRENDIAFFKTLCTTRGANLKATIGGR